MPRFFKNSSEHVDSNRGRPPGRFQLRVDGFTAKNKPLLSFSIKSRFSPERSKISGSDGFGSVRRRGTGWGADLIPFGL